MPRLEGLTVRVLDLYCRHVCLLRPLGEGGKMRVTTHMAQIELALAPFCSKLADLGLPYKKLRLLRYMYMYIFLFVCVCVCVTYQFVLLLFSDVYYY